MNSYKHSIYFSGSWDDEHWMMNAYVISKLVKEHGLLVVGDHRDYRGKLKHERGLNYPRRVNEIIESCSGMVVLFPQKGYPQTTTTMPFLELLLACKHQIPVLLLCEEGVQFEWKQDGNEVLISFGNSGAGSALPLSPEMVDVNTFDVRRLRTVYSLLCPASTLIDEPLVVPSNPTDAKDLPRRMSSLIEEFAGSFREQKTQYVFNIMPYSKRHERGIVAWAVFEQTGLSCVNGSDVSPKLMETRNRIPDKRTAIRHMIADAWFVIADISYGSQACIFETGVAVGSEKPTFVITSTPKKPQPFGVGELPSLSYANGFELDRAVRQHCLPYRRRVFNTELPEWTRTRKLPESSMERAVVLLVHGIHTQAQWQETVKNVLQSDGTTEVIPIKYGLLDVVRFCLPFRMKKASIETLKSKILTAIKAREGAHLSIIAHSFGTYAVTQIMLEEPILRPNRLVLAGSIVPQQFRWDTIEPQPTILNDCGIRDIFPILASVLNSDYGPSGTFGFGTPGVEDRFHDFKHSDYFGREFVDRFWKPFILDGNSIPSQYVRAHQGAPHLMSMATISLLRLGLSVFLAGAVGYFGYLLLSPPIRILAGWLGLLS